MNRAKEICKAQLRLQNTWNKSPRREHEKGKKEDTKKESPKCSKFYFKKTLIYTPKKLNNLQVG